MITWDDRAKVGDITVAAYLHDSGTHSLSFTRYGAPTLDVGLMFDAGGIDALIALLQRMRADHTEAEVVEDRIR